MSVNRASAVKRPSADDPDRPWMVLPHELRFPLWAQAVSYARMQVALLERNLIEPKRKAEIISDLA